MISLSHFTNFIPKKRPGAGKRFQFVEVLSEVLTKKRRYSSKSIDNKPKTNSPVLHDFINESSNKHLQKIEGYDSFLNLHNSKEVNLADSFDPSKDERDFESTLLENNQNKYDYIKEIKRENDEFSTYSHELQKIRHSSSSFFSQFLSFSNSLTGYNSWIPGVELSKEDAHFYHVFVNGFIAAISPQYTCPELSPGAIFIPQGANSPIIQEIFYVCGASFLSWEIPELKDSVQKRYISCLNNLACQINSPGVDITEDWMLAAMLLLCLRDKYFGSVSSKPAGHITMAFQIIKKRRLKRIYNSVKVRELQYDNAIMYSRPNDSTSIALLNNVVNNPSIDNSKDSSVWNWLLDEEIPAEDFTPNEKVLMESFLYNYSVLLLICDKNLIGFLPSPFDIFEEYKYILCANMYKCTVYWMNNPVFGAALDAFEFAAKASWLCFKSPLNESNMGLARDLYEKVLLYTPPSLSEEIFRKESKENYTKLKESTIVADIVAKAVSILMIRILNSDSLPGDPLIQHLVLEIYYKFQLLTPTSSLWPICGWPLVVTGVVTLLTTHREYFRSQCSRLSELFHALYFAQIIEILFKAWGDSFGHTPAWDILFDRSSLLAFCI